VRWYVVTTHLCCEWATATTYKAVLAKVGHFERRNLTRGSRFFSRWISANADLVPMYDGPMQRCETSIIPQVGTCIVLEERFNEEHHPN